MVDRLKEIEKERQINNYRKEKSEIIREGKKEAAQLYRRITTDTEDFYSCYQYKVTPNPVSPSYLAGNQICLTVLRFAVLAQNIKNLVEKEPKDFTKVKGWRNFLRVCTLYTKYVNEIDEKTDKALDRIHSTTEASFIATGTNFGGLATLDALFSIYPEALRGLPTRKQRKQAPKKLGAILNELAKPEELALISLLCRIKETLLDNGTYVDFSEEIIKPKELDLTHVVNMITTEDIISDATLFRCNATTKYETYKVLHEYASTLLATPERRLRKLQPKTAFIYTKKEAKAEGIKLVNQNALPFKDDKLKAEVLELFSHCIGHKLAEIGVGINETRKQLDKGRGTIWSGKPEDINDPLGILKVYYNDARKKLEYTSEKLDKQDDYTLYFNSQDFPIGEITRDEYQSGAYYINHGGLEIERAEVVKLVELAGEEYDKAQNITRTATEIEGLNSTLLASILNEPKPKAKTNKRNTAKTIKDSGTKSIKESEPKSIKDNDTKANKDSEPKSIKESDTKTIKDSGTTTKPDSPPETIRDKIKEAS